MRYRQGAKTLLLGFGRCAEFTPDLEETTRSAVQKIGEEDETEYIYRAVKGIL